MLGMGKDARKASTQSKHVEPDKSRSLVAELGTFVLGAYSVFLFFSLLSFCLPSLLVVNFDNGLYADGGLYADEAQARENLMGPIGGIISGLLVKAFGWSAFVWVIVSIYLARKLWQLPALNLRPSWPKVVGGTLLVISISTASAVMSGYRGGGMLGARVAYVLLPLFNDLGVLLLSLWVGLVSLYVGWGVGLYSYASLLIGLCRVCYLVCLDSFALVVLGIRVVVRGIVRMAGASVRTLSGCLVSSMALLRAVATFPKWIFTHVKSVKLYLLGAVTFVRRRVWPLRFRRSVEQTPQELAQNTQVAQSSLIDLDESYVLDGETELSTPDSSGDELSINIRDSAGGRERKVKGKSSGIFKSRGVVTRNIVSPELLRSALDDEHVAQSREDLLRNSKLLERALADFKVGGKIVEVEPGPVITLYQFEPAPGVKVQRVISLADDLALALKVASVRVYAPVPGKGTVGIEVPNKKREMVRLREIIESTPFADIDSDLSLAVGKDTFGNPFVTDLAKMPHLLIAGATGTGKSVCINSLLLSLLYRNDPQTLRLILIDPKMLELSVYQGIPHLKSPVITDPKRARGVLWWAVEEMERRYSLMMRYGVRSLAGYNDLMKEKASQISDDEVVVGELEQLPRIVIVVDELADLMLSVGKEVEELLTRLAQKARASGIHLMLATQRPSVNVITGLIKANFPSRISFQVASRIDSRTVLDTSGAERLLGHGDMLFMAPGLGRIKRLHAAYVSDQEVQRVVEALRKVAEPDYDPEIEKIIERLMEGEASLNSQVEFEEFDPLYDRAVAFVVERGQASTSMVQRAFRIGYNRAARILECMEREGVVGPAEGAKPREIRVGG